MFGVTLNLQKQLLFAEGNGECHSGVSKLAVQFQGEE